MSRIRRFLACLALASVVGLLAAVPDARGVVPRAVLWERWLAHDEASMRSISHRAWEQFLIRYLRIDSNGVHRVAYGQVTDADRQRLERYVDHLARLPIGRYNRDQQLAYWINLYNALVVRLVLDHYPVGSILDVGGPQSTDGGPWEREVVAVAGEPLSLNDIVHRILRPIWNDPRIHYALSCGALGCPNLPPQPFEGVHIERQLTEAAMSYINDPRCTRIDGHRLIVSSIFRWYKTDFGGSDRAVIRHLMAYAEPELAMTLQRFDRINGDMFDWRLNDATLL